MSKIITIQTDIINHTQCEVLHDFMAFMEGGSRVVMTLADQLDWSIVTGCASDNQLVVLDSYKLKVTTLGRNFSLPLVRAHSVYQRWKKYTSQKKVLIYSGNYTPLAAGNNQRSRNIYYCHTPPRFVFDQYHYFLENVPTLLRPMYRHIIARYRIDYLTAISEMDVVLANSKNVSLRIKQYLNIEANIVYPPCNIDRFFSHSSDNYYLSTARLDPLKRVDRIVRAFIKMPDKKLVVISTGSELKRLQRLADQADNIHFLGEVSDEKLRSLLSRCIATIYVPVDEDFGLSPVESLASGKPVIGVSEGGICETVTDGETGILLKKNPTEWDIVDTISKLTATKAMLMHNACIFAARKFSTTRFVDEIKQYIA